MMSDNKKLAFLQISQLATPVFIKYIAKKYSVSYEDAQDLCADSVYQIFNAIERKSAFSFPYLNDEKAQMGYLETHIRWQFFKGIRRKNQLGQKINTDNIELVSTISQEKEIDTLTLLDHLIAHKKIPLSNRQKQLWTMIYSFTPINKILDTLDIDRQTLYREKHRLFKKIRQHISPADIELLVTQITFSNSSKSTKSGNGGEDGEEK